MPLEQTLECVDLGCVMVLYYLLVSAVLMSKPAFFSLHTLQLFVECSTVLRLQFFRRNSSQNLVVAMCKRTLITKAARFSLNPILAHLGLVRFLSGRRLLELRRKGFI